MGVCLGAGGGADLGVTGVGGDFTAVFPLVEEGGTGDFSPSLASGRASDFVCLAVPFCLGLVLETFFRV